MRLRTANNRSKRRYVWDHAGFGKLGRWKGIFRRRMQKEVRKMRREAGFPAKSPPFHRFHHWDKSRHKSVPVSRPSDRDFSEDKRPTIKYATGPSRFQRTFA